MAQIREFESTTESYFILDGVSYPKVYEAMLDNGYSDTKIKLVGTNRDTTPLVFSTQYTNIRVDGDSFDTALEAISRLNQIVFSKGGGSGTGGATNVITEDSDTVAFTGNGTVVTPLKAEVKSDGLDYIPLTGTEIGSPVTGPITLEEEGSQTIVSPSNVKVTSLLSENEKEFEATTEIKPLGLNFNLTNTTDDVTTLYNIIPQFSAESSVDDEFVAELPNESGIILLNTTLGYNSVEKDTSILWTVSGGVNHVYRVVIDISLISPIYVVNNALPNVDNILRFDIVMPKLGAYCQNVFNVNTLKAPNNFSISIDEIDIDEFGTVTFSNIILKETPLPNFRVYAIVEYTKTP